MFKPFVCPVLLPSRSASCHYSAPAPAYLCQDTHTPQTPANTHRHIHTQIPANCCGRWPTLLSPSSNYPRWDPVSTTTAAMIGPAMSDVLVFTCRRTMWFSLITPQVLKVASCYGYVTWQTKISELSDPPQKIILHKHQFKSELFELNMTGCLQK